MAQLAIAVAGSYLGAAAAGTAMFVNGVMTAGAQWGFLAGSCEGKTYLPNEGRSQPTLCPLKEDFEHDDS